MKKLIEMVCTGNNGRSPVAELLAQHYLTRIGADQEYRVISSGTAVSMIGTPNIPLVVMKPVVQTGLDRRLYDLNEITKVEKALRTDDVDAVRSYFSRVERIFVEEEKDHRATTLQTMGIPGIPKSTRDQTIARRDTVAVFPVDKKNKDKVLAIYAGSGYNPVIEVLSAYATGNPDAEITNTFGILT